MLQTVHLSAQYLVGIMVSDLAREASLNIHYVIDLSTNNNLIVKVYLHTKSLPYVCSDLQFFRLVKLQVLEKSKSNQISETL
jgi:hypothetical protein